MGFSAAMGYLQRLGLLSRNAKLYIASTVLQGFSSGIWGVLFLLYLNLDAVGFEPNFISNVFTAGALATGLIALPAGLIIERLGTKRALLISLGAGIANLVQITVLQPSLLLFASLISGLISTLGLVAAAPFLMENSRPEERTYLFSINSALIIIMSVIGDFTGGILPSMFKGFSGTADPAQTAVFAYRMSLGISTVFALVAVVPILLIRGENGKNRQRMSELLALRNVKSGRTILKLITPMVITGIGAGFVVPLFNLFFKLRFNATAEQIGVLNGLGSATLVAGILFAPVLSQRFSKVKAIAICQFASMPFIMLITLSPNLVLAGGSYIARNALMNMASPLSGSFQMEVVTETERATTSGLLMMSDGVPRAVTASISGEMMTLSDFYTPFLIMAVTYFIGGLLFYAFFRKTHR